MAENARPATVPLTDEDLERFHANAPAALARRGWGYLREEVLGGLRAMLFGGLPIAGILWWGWSASEMFAFLLIATWVGILTDVATYLALKDRAEAFAAAMYDDWHVWVVVDALRNQTNEAPESHLKAKWDPGGGVFVDFAMGGISTLLIVRMLTYEGLLAADDFASRGLLLALAGLLVMRVGGAIVEIAHHRANHTGALVEHADEDRPVRVLLGLRGVGLFLLVFLVAFVTEAELPDSAPQIIMLVINGLVVAYGALNLTGPVWLRGETKWLRAYLAQRAADGQQ